GSTFKDQSNSQVVFKVGASGSRGVMRITDFVFTTAGPTACTIVVEWNVAQPSGVSAGAGMRNVGFTYPICNSLTSNSDLIEHLIYRTGGDKLVMLYFAQLVKLNITSHCHQFGKLARNYTWVWVTDHNLDSDGLSQLMVYSSRGVLSESQGPVWMIST
ncbi:glycoside hydrolase family 55 protein, partial [Laccaria amethystina LaAM-08-1]